MKNLIVLMCCFTSLNVFAKGGDRVGNGGDVVVCGEKAELLDIYEAKMKGYTFIQLQADNYQDVASEIIEKRLKNLQPKKAATYLSRLETFSEESQLIPGIRLNDVDDAGLVAIPTGCKLEQIVVQLKEDDIPAGESRYTISADLWNKLDAFNQGVLTLHELVYRDAIENDSASSMVVRAMIGQLIKQKMDMNIFYGLDNVLSRKGNLSHLEVGLSTITATGKTIFSVAKDASEESILTIKSDEELSFYLSSDYKKLPTVNGYTFKIRLSDKQLMASYTKENVETGKFVKAGEEYKLTPLITAIADQPLFLARPGFVPFVSIDLTKEFNLKLLVKVLNVERLVELKRVNGLSINNEVSLSQDMPSTLTLSGSFEIEAYGMKLNKPKEMFQSISLNLSEQKIAGFGSEEFISFSTSHGDFKCKGLKQLSLGFYDYSRCTRTANGYSINLSTYAVKKLIIPFNVGEGETTSFSLYGDREFTSVGMMNIQTEKSVYLGKRRGALRKDIYLPIGKYRVSRSAAGSYVDSKGIEYTIYADKASYEIYNDGSVVANIYNN